MNFRQFIEQGTTGVSKLGGPSASGRLGQSLATPQKGMGLSPYKTKLKPFKHKDIMFKQFKL